jgi:hypothetical protein
MTALAARKMSQKCSARATKISWDSAVSARGIFCDNIFKEREMEQVLSEVDVVRKWNHFGESNQSCVEFYKFIKQSIFREKASRFFDDKYVDAMTYSRVQRKPKLLSIFHELNALVMFESFLLNRFDYNLDDHGLYGVEYFKDLFKDAIQLMQRKRDASPPRRPKCHPDLDTVIHIVISTQALPIDTLVALNSTAKMLWTCFRQFSVQTRVLTQLNFHIIDRNTWELFCYTLRYWRRLSMSQAERATFNYQHEFEQFVGFRLFPSYKPPAGTLYAWNPLVGRPACEYFFYLHNAIQRQSRCAFRYFYFLLDGPCEFEPNHTLREAMFARRDLQVPQLTGAYTAALNWEFPEALQLTEEFLVGFDWQKEEFRPGCVGLPIVVE